MPRTVPRVSSAPLPAENYFDQGQQQLRIQGIDGLRAIAVLLVIYQHYFSWMTPWPGGDFGGLGVSVFFVISGYLITGILLREREAPGPTGPKFMGFYVRRTMRIVPVLVLVVAAAYLLRIYGFVEYSPLWFLGFATNGLVAYLNAWPAASGHLWSLAVEEQFYLIWPAVILLVPRRHMLTAIVVAILLAPLATAMWAALKLSPIQLYVAPFGHVDALGLGALVAYAQFANPSAARAWRVPGAVIGMLGAIATVAFIAAWLRLSAGPLPAFLAFTFANLTTVALLHNLWRGRSTLSECLAFPPLRYLGTISYGLYLWHLPMLYFTQDRLRDWHLPSAVVSLSALVLSLALATVCWYWYERPILAHKDTVSEYLAGGVHRQKRLS